MRNHTFVFSFPICTVITSFPHTSFKHKDITLHTPVGHTQQVGVLLVGWYLTGVSALGMSLAFTYIFVCMAICQFVRLTELTRTRTRALGHTCARQHTYTHTHTHARARACARTHARTRTHTTNVFVATVWNCAKSDSSLAVAMMPPMLLQMAVALLYVVNPPGTL